MSSLAHSASLILLAFLTFLPAGAPKPGTRESTALRRDPAPVSKDLSQTARLQLKYLDAELFRVMGLTGKKVRIAVIDGGFPGTNTHPGLKHLIDNKQIVATWDFIRNKEDVYTGNPHGTAVLSCIAGIYEGTALGMAPDAEFLLARTEMNGEPLREELNWARAVEWAVANGAQIIQSSIGYTYHRYYIRDLDGKTSPAAKAAMFAARSNVLIVNSIGNEGRKKWFYPGTPADADSILSVGAIDPATGIVADFSSRGPTADGRMKPNVGAPGKVAALTPKGIRTMFGTSFAAPLVSGFAACLWQMDPSATAMDILRRVEQSGHLYPYFDYAHGYGIPKASRALKTPSPRPGTAPVIEEADGGIAISVGSIPARNGGRKEDGYLYYHIARPDGYLRSYGVYRIIRGGAVLIGSDKFLPGDLIRAHHAGYTTEWRANN